MKTLKNTLLIIALTTFCSWQTFAQKPSKESTELWLFDTAVDLLLNSDKCDFLDGAQIIIDDTGNFDIKMNFASNINPYPYYKSCCYQYNFNIKNVLFNYNDISEVKNQTCNYFKMGIRLKKGEIYQGYYIEEIDEYKKMNTISVMYIFHPNKESLIRIRKALYHLAELNDADEYKEIESNENDF